VSRFNWEFYNENQTQHKGTREYCFSNFRHNWLNKHDSIYLPKPCINSLWGVSPRKVYLNKLKY